jgi:hypothetical protein
MSVSDFQSGTTSGRSLVQVALTVDRDRFLRLLHERLWM